MCNWWRLKRYWTMVGVLVLGLSGYTSESPFSISTSVSPQPVFAHTPVTFTILVSWKGRAHAFKVVQSPQLKLSNFILEESGAATKTQILATKDTVQQRLFTFRLKPISAGEGHISASPIVLQDKQGVSFTVPVPQTTLEVMPAGNPKPQYLAYIYLLLLIVLAVALIYAFALYFKKKRTRIKGGLDAGEIREIFRNRLSSEVDPKGRNLYRSFEQLEKIYWDYRRFTAEIGKDPLLSGQMESSEKALLTNSHQFIEETFKSIRLQKEQLTDALFLQVYQAVSQVIESGTSVEREENLVK